MTISWALIAVLAGCLALLGGGTLLFALLAQRSSGTSGLLRSLTWLFAPVLSVVVLVTVFAYLSLWSHTIQVPPAAPMPVTETEASPLPVLESQEVNVPPRKASSPNSVVADSTGTATGNGTPGDSSEPSDKDAAEANSPLPEWIRNGPSQPGAASEDPAGETRRVVVSSKQYATVDEAEEDVLAQAIQEVRQDFHRVYPEAGEWTLPAELVPFRLRHVEEITRQSGSVTFRVYRVHRQLELSPATREAVHEIWRSQVVQHRLWNLGILLGLATLVTGAATTYLRVDARTNGAYRGRLKLATVSLVVAGGLVAAAVL